MKISCSYCGNKFNDTEETCPHCGAPNEGVVRTASSQPVTIEQLQDWYRSKNLPPYETTRFFIGQDYKGARAFGIYKDEATGNYVVYKNNSSGERKIRYEGTDEAYAVNELFQRLKQEIIQQKAAQTKKNSGAPPKQGSRSKSSGTKAPKKKKNPVIEFFTTVLAILVLLFGNPLGLVLGGLAVIGVVLEVSDAFIRPDAGYYLIDNAVYYNMTSSDRESWYRYDGNDKWTGVSMLSINSDVYSDKNVANKYKTSDEWNSSLNCTDIKNNIVYRDFLKGLKVGKGYYKYNERTYYHLHDSGTSGWYVFNDTDRNWSSVETDDIPEVLTHSSVSPDFFFLPVWDASTQLTDFEDTAFYSAYYASSSGSSYDSGYSSWSWDDDDDYDYSWGSDDDYDWSWDSGSSDWDSDW